MNDRELGEVLMPFAASPAATNNFMAEQSRHEGGNALASNSEANEIATIKAQVFMAKQFPRNIQVAWENILNECQRASLAERAVYSFPRGKEMVTGPSIRLAEVLARNFGNIKFSYDVIERRPSRGKEPGSSVIRAWAWDLESNVTVERRFEVKHFRSTKNGGYSITDDRDIYELEANMASRRIRACILQIIPGDVTDAAVAACRKTSTSGIAKLMSDKNERSKLIAQMIRIYSKMGVTQDDLETNLSCKAEDWTADHMLRLKEIKASLEDGNSTMGEYFPRLAIDNQNETINKAQVKKLMEMAKASGMQGAISDELKKMGIAKFADVPVGKFEDVAQLIQGYGTPSNAESTAQIGGGNAEANPESHPESPLEEDAP